MAGSGRAFKESQQGCAELANLEMDALEDIGATNALGDRFDGVDGELEAEGLLECDFEGFAL